jgi:hypothetical protein
MWHKLNLYAGHYTISIEKLRRGQNDATRARAAAVGRAGPWAWAWRGRQAAAGVRVCVSDVPIQPGGRRACRGGMGKVLSLPF